MSDRAIEGRPQVVLLVDDEPDILDSLETLLASSLPGVEVATAASGPAALDVLARRPVDLIVTDYKMPGMTGLELLQRAMKVAPKVPRILVTAFPDLDIAIRAINETGIENFFTKPFEPEQVIGVVRGLLQEQRAQTMRDRLFARSLDTVRRAAERTGA